MELRAIDIFKVKVKIKVKDLWQSMTGGPYGTLMLIRYLLMQKLPYKDFSFTDVTLDEGGTTLQRILNTPDDCDYGYWLICDLEYTN